MTEFNPLAGSILSSTQTQRQLAVEKRRQLRRAQNQRKNVTAAGDYFEHQVESADRPTPIEDEPPHRSPRTPRSSDHDQATDDNASHLDITG